MLAGFPTLPQPSVGDPSMHDLFGIYQFLRCILNFLFCVVLLNRWNQHADPAVVPYIDQQLVPDPGAQPINHVGSSSTQIQALKDRWCFQAKKWLEIRNMNKALTEVLLKLLPTDVSTGYAKVLLNDPNITFGVTLQYFYTMFGDNDPIEKENSCMSMSAARDGFSFATLRTRIEDGCAYAAFTDVPLRTPRPSTHSPPSSSAQECTPPRTHYGWTYPRQNGRP